MFYLVVKDMYVWCLLCCVVQRVVVAMNMTGEVGLALQVPADVLQRAGGGRAQQPPVLMLQLGHEGLTVARVEEPCVYKYPKKKHFNALLSDMMNELTKIFMRTSELLRSAARRARSGNSNARFRVVSSKDSSYFDDVYANMTVQYKKFYEKALEKGSQRSGRDPCQHQPELRRLWEDMLEASLATLRAAALRCVRLQLETEGLSKDSKLKNRLGQFLLKELRRFPSHQLDVLCRVFSLCYKELLHSNGTLKFNS